MWTEEETNHAGRETQTPETKKPRPANAGRGGKDTPAGLGREKREEERSNEEEERLPGR